MPWFGATVFATLLLAGSVTLERPELRPYRRGNQLLGGGMDGIKHTVSLLRQASSFAATDMGHCALDSGKVHTFAREKKTFETPGANAVACDWLSSHTCFVADASVTCFGGNDSGQSTGTPTQDDVGPTQISVPSVKAIALSANATALLDSRGQIWLLGRLEGLPGTDLRKLPWPAATGVALVDFGLCAVLAGRVRCTMALKALTSLTDVVQVTMGNGHVCAARRNGKVHCERDPYNATDALIESGTGTLSNVVEVALPSGGRHACARHGDGSVSCWGNDGAEG